MKEAIAIMAVAVCAILSLLLNAINFVLLLAVLAGIRGLRTLLLDVRGKEEIMTEQEQKLIDGVKSLAEAVANEEEHIDTIIDALRQPHDSPVVAQVIAELEATRQKVSAFHANDDQAADEATAPAGSGDMGAS